MKGDAKYYGIIVLVFLVLFGAEYVSDGPVEYDKSLSYRDKNPYGSEVLNKLMPEIFGNKNIEHSNLTLYELEYDLGMDVNLLIMAENFLAGEEDIDVLLEQVFLGMDALIIAENMFYLEDSLKFTLRVNELPFMLSADNDTATLSFTNSALPGQDFKYKKDAINSYFDDIELPYEVIAENASGDPVAIRIKQGMGSLILCATPIAFTNTYLFLEDNHQFASTILSFLPEKDLIWTEYYQLGRQESGSSLRVLLTSPPLRLATTVAIGAILLFMLFEAKRKQRVIPVIKPLANTTLEFIGTIANLYLRKKDHKDIAQKRIQYFQEYIHTHYFMSFKTFDEHFFEKLAAKSGNSVVDVKKLFDLINRLKESSKVSENDLKELSEKIEAFYGRNQRK